METWSEAVETEDGGVGEVQPAPDEAPENVDGASEDPIEAWAPTEGSLDAVEAVLDQVDRALARLDDGTYGRCVSCGESIDDVRLAGDPTVLSCRDCTQPELIEAD
ncbi:MAG: TraR/DksA C4-type zinc finger protein [Acidimicrobiales bacterium]|jgi:RNA polymerase-binding transcription factor DksA